MSLLVRLLVLVCCLFNGKTQAQDLDGFKFAIEGSFQREEAVFGLPPVRFKVNWNEENNEIKGTYSDNFFAPVDPVTVTGVSRPAGRSFNVHLPDIVRGTNSIEIQLLTPGLVNGSVSATFSPQDSRGQSIDFFNVPVQMTTDETFEAGEIADDPSQISCVVGMGALTGFCGQYAGTITEITDTNNRCRHFINSDARLELSTTGDFLLHLRSPYLISPTLVPENTYMHQIGSLNGAGPLTTTVDITGRNCGELIGTTFRGGCQTLALEGTFSNFAGVRDFAGTYTITDEEDEASCSYRMRVERIEL